MKDENKFTEVVRSSRDDEVIRLLQVFAEDLNRDYHEQSDHSWARLAHQFHRALLIEAARRINRR